ncbi:Uncharacterised protein [uncultured archaeon]|nr:Uncharacterised protein [uncultured archaeon]
MASVKKGQAIPIDLMAGLFIFLVLIAYFMILWDIYSLRYFETMDKTNSDMEVLAVSDALVSSPGLPENWTAAPLDAKAIGLAKKPNELDPYKVSALSSLPYANARQMLGLDRDFYINIGTPEGASIAVMGQAPAGNVSRASEITRVALYNGQIVHVRVRIYES